MASQTASTNQPPPAVITVPVGQPALTALGQAVKRAQSGDQFARVVVVADHLDAASSVRHWLGALGVVNVTVQTGGRLAADLAQPRLASGRGHAVCGAQAADPDAGIPGGAAGGGAGDRFRRLATITGRPPSLIPVHCRRFPRDAGTPATRRPRRVNRRGAPGLNAARHREAVRRIPGAAARTRLLHTRRAARAGRRCRR